MSLAFSYNTPWGAVANQANLQGYSPTLQDPPLGSGTSPLVESDHDEEASNAPKAKGGRPRDYVWTYFNGDLVRATCKYCNWATERPKAFRMRQHILVCPSVAEEDRDKIKALQEAKDIANAAKTQAAQGGPAPNQGQDQQMDLTIGTSSNLPDLSAMIEPAIDSSKRRRTELKESKNAASKRAAVSASMPTILHRSPVTCQVIDVMSGKPAAGMNCRLDRLTPNGFVLLSSSATDPAGKCAGLLSPSPRIDAGIYKITFFTQEFFSLRGISSFYPFVEITFEIREEDAHFHIPLLLSPFAYSTHRGSS